MLQNLPNYIGGQEFKIWILAGYAPPVAMWVRVNYVFSLG